VSLQPKSATLCERERARTVLQETKRFGNLIDLQYGNLERAELILGMLPFNVRLLSIDHLRHYMLHQILMLRRF